MRKIYARYQRNLFRHVIDSFYDRNTPTGTKQLILSSIIFAVRELAGIEERKEEMVLNFLACALL